MMLAQVTGGVAVVSVEENAETSGGSAAATPPHRRMISAHPQRGQVDALRLASTSALAAVMRHGHGYVNECVQRPQDRSNDMHLQRAAWRRRQYGRRQCGRERYILRPAQGQPQSPAAYQTGRIVRFYCNTITSRPSCMRPTPDTTDMMRASRWK
jgi:hypothetical protein